MISTYVDAIGLHASPAGGRGPSGDRVLRRYSGAERQTVPPVPGRKLLLICSPFRRPRAVWKNLNIAMVGDLEIWSHGSLPDPGAGEIQRHRCFFHRPGRAQRCRSPILDMLDEKGIPWSFTPASKRWRAT